MRDCRCKVRSLVQMMQSESILAVACWHVRRIGVGVKNLECHYESLGRRRAIKYRVW